MPEQNQKEKPEQNQKEKRPEQEAKWQRDAFREISTIDFWFRKHFNLAPTDPRYLDATREQMWVEFWCHQLDTLRELADEESEEEADTLEGLLKFADEYRLSHSKEMSDAEFKRKLAKLDKADDEREAREGKNPSRVALASKDRKNDDPIVIKFRRPMSGRHPT